MGQKPETPKDKVDAKPHLSTPLEPREVPVHRVHGPAERAELPQRLGRELLDLLGLLLVLDPVADDAVQLRGLEALLLEGVVVDDPQEGAEELQLHLITRKERSSIIRIDHIIRLKK